MDLTTPDVVMHMATNLKRGRSSVSYFKETWKAKLQQQVSKNDKFCI